MTESVLKLGVMITDLRRVGGTTLPQAYQNPQCQGCLQWCMKGLCHSVFAFTLMPASFSLLRWLRDWSRLCWVSRRRSSAWIAPTDAPWTLYRLGTKRVYLKMTLNWSRKENVCLETGLKSTKWAVKRETSSFRLGANQSSDDVTVFSYLQELQEKLKI